MRKLFIFSVVFTITGLGAVIVNGRPFSSTLGAPVVLISEEDGDPISRLRLLQVPNDSLTDAGGGILSLDTSSGDANAVDVAISTTALQALIDSGFDTVGLSTQTNADNILTNAVDISTVNIAKVDRIGDTMTGTLIVPQVDVTTTSYQEDTGGERAFSKIQISAGSSNRLHTRFDFNEGATSRAGYMVTPLGISSASFQGRLDYAFSACDPDEFDCDASPFASMRLDMRSGQKRLRIGTQFLDEDINGNTCDQINLTPGFGNVFLTLDTCFVEDDLSSQFIYQADKHIFTSASDLIVFLSTTSIDARVPILMNGNLIINAGQIDSSEFIGPLVGAASENVLKAGDTMTGNLNVTGNISVSKVFFSSGTGDNVMLGNLGINGTTTLGSSLTVNAAANFTGNVGIRTDSPVHELVVRGSNPQISVHANEVTESATLRIRAGGAGGTRSCVHFGDTTDDDIGRICYEHGSIAGDNQMDFTTFGAINMSITTDGNVGIGDSLPTTAKLTVKISEANQEAIRISSQNASVMFVVDRLGNVGIGTASPCSTCTLHVAGSASITGNIQVGTGGQIGNIDAGEYTAVVSTTTNLENDAVAISGSWRFMRIGDQVMVTGRVTLNATASGDATTRAEISLPIPSTITSGNELSGQCTTFGTTDRGIRIVGFTANNTALLEWEADSTDTLIYGCSFMYEVK